jgi:hypothetical protein
MHVLVTEAQFGIADRIIRRLGEIGVRVSTCHDRAGYCRVLQPGGRCPLDAITDPVDLVVDVRGAGEQLTVREYGVICAVRAMRQVKMVPAERGMPVVVPSGLRDLTATMTEDQLVAACRQGLLTQIAARFGWAGRPERVLERVGAP